MAKKQPELAGFERPSHPAVDKAAEDYVTARDQRMELTTREKERKKLLINAMRDANLKSYVYVDGEVEREVKIAPKENVTVRKVRVDDDEADDDK